MRNQLLFKKAYNKGIIKFFFGISFIFSFSSALGQEIIINKTAVESETVCKQYDITLEITGNPPPRPQEVVLIIDRSGSMSYGDSPKPISYAQDAAIDFVNNFFLPVNNPTGDNKIALVTYSSSASVDIGLTDSSGQASLISEINSITTGGYTNTEGAIIAADNLLTTTGSFDCDTARSIILLSDGVATARDGGSNCSSTTAGTACQTEAIQAGIDAQTTTVLGEVYNQNIFTIGLIGAISGTEETIALDTLDGIQNGGAFSTEDNADLTGIYNQILGQLVAAATQLDDQALVSDIVQSGFTVISSSLEASKGSATNVGQLISWYVNSVGDETITLNYTIQAEENAACGSQEPGNSIISYEDSMCNIQTETFANPNICVPCPVITPTISQVGCSSTINYSGAVNQNGCTSLTDTLTWEFFLDGSLVGTSTDASGTFDYTGGSFEGTFTAELNYSGTYGAGCKLPDLQETASLVIPDVLTLSLVSSTDPECGGASTGEIVVLATFGTPPYQYTINGGSTYQNNGTFSGLTAGTYTIEVLDDAGCTDSITVTLNDGDDEDPTWINPPTDQTVECDGTADPDDAFADWLESFTGTDNSGSATVTNDSEGLSDLCGATGTETVTFTLTDDCGNSISADATFTIEDTTDPTLNIPDDVTVECNDDTSSASTGTATGNDTCGAVTITQSDSSVDACGNTQTITRTWTATDECGNSTSATQIISVVDTTDPTLNIPNDVTVECTDDTSSASTGTATGSDTCGAVTITQSDSSVDACGNTQTITRTWTATDECGNSTSATQIISVVDTTDPTLNIPNDVTVECTDDTSSASTGTATGSDTCGAVTITQSDSSVDACGNTQTITRTWTATDECGNSTSATQIISVVDTTDPTLNIPNDVTVECTDDTSSASTGTATGSDTCGAVTITQSDSSVDACGNTQTITRTWTATDECGNSTSATQIISVVDTTDPTLNIPNDVTVECTDDTSSASTGTATGSDTCGAVTITQSDSSVDACGNTQTITRTWTATDECGNSTSATQIISVVDTTDPTLNIPNDVTVECTDDTSSASTGTATGNDTCGAVTITQSDSSVDACGNTQTITRTWTATDECGNSTSATQIISVVDTTDPTLNIPNDVTVECTDDTSSASTGTATGSDTCGAVTITQSDSSVDACGNTQTITRTWTATDECGNSTSATQIISVVDTTDPTLNIPNDVTVECTDDTSSASTGTATGSDTCGAVTITQSDSSVDACGNTQTITRTWTATDECGNSTSATQIISVVDTTDPTIDIDADDIVVECDGTGNSGAIQAWLDANGGASASDSCGSVTWTNNYGGDTSDCATPIEVIFTVTDECGNSASTSATYAISDTTAPTIDVEADDLTVQCDGNGNDTALQDWLNSFGGASASDDCSAIAWSNDFTALSDDCGATGSATVTFTVTDGCGNSSTTTAIFTIEDTTDPTFNEALPSDVTEECDAVSDPTTLTADDNCGTAEVTFTEVRTDGDCPSNYSLLRTWTATDECGLTTIHTQTVTVQDTTDPTFNEALPSDVTEECDAVSDPATLTADDNCGTANVTFTEVRTDGDCPSNYSLLRTWTATDECGLTTIHTQTITVQDTTAPTISTVAADQTVQCDGSGNTDELQAWLDTNAGANATDNCGTVTWTNNFTGLTNGCGETGLALVTFTATDECNNSSSTTALFTILDLLPPTIDTEASDLTVECDGNGNITDLNNWLDTNGGASSSDICGEITWSNNYTELSDDCGSTGSATVIFTATDDCGNATTTSATFTIEDTTAPTFNEALPSNVTEECDAVSDPATLTADDNCSIITVIFNEVRTDGSCPSDYILVRTWTATDECGFETVHTQTITVQDTTAPTFNETLPSDVTEECDAVSDPATLTADDNCGTAEVTFTEVRTDGDCPSNYSLLRTWTATDECGLTTIHTQTVTVQDTTAPTIDIDADNIVVECDGTGNSGAIQAWLDANGGASASDSCGSVTWTNNYGGDTSDCATPIEVIFTVTDECGNSASTSATYAISDTTAPTIDVEADDLTVQCDGNGNDTALQDWLNSFGGASASDDCSAIAWSNDFTALSDDCGATGSATVTFTVTDGCGNSSTTTAIFTIEDTTAPTFNEALPSDVTEECDAVSDPATLTADDNCGTANVTFTEVRTDGDCPSNYSLLRTWTATDECGLTTIHTQTITVQDTTAPTFNEALPSDVTEECDAVSDPATLTADDNCGTANVTFTEVRTDGDCPSNYSLLRTWTATDECGLTTIHTQTITVQDTTAPTFNETLPSDVTEECDAVSDPATLTADDNCGTANVTFTEVRTDGDCPSNYSLLRTWTATDECGLTTIHTQTVTVQDTTAPTIDIDADDIVVECDGTGNSGAIQAWLDANGGASASDSCGSVTWTNNYGGDTSDCATPIEVIFTVTDECGNSASTSATYAISDTTAPTIDVEADDLTVQCDGNGNDTALQDWLNSFGGASASDDCSAIAWSNDFTALSDDCGATGSATVTFTVTDGCGNSSTTTAIFTIEDTTDPTFNEALPSDVTEECDAVSDPTTLTADDNCGTAEVTFTEVRTDGDCPSNYSLLRTWTATDECGLTTIHTQTVTVQDTTDPTFNETLPSDVTEECDAVSDPTTLTADDNCGTAEVTFTEVRTDGDCPSNYSLLRTWTATDECGLTTIHTQTVTVQDTTDPTFNETLPSDVTEECDAVSDPATLTADDNCGTAEVTFTEVRTDGDCPSNYSLLRTWTATDECGLTTIHTQTVTVQDTTAPTIDIDADNIVVECDGTGNSGAIQAWLDANGGASASDSCGSVTWTNNYGGDTSDCATPIEVIFTVTDECGNSASTSATYAISDTTAPTIDVEADDLTVQCDGNGNDTALQDWLNSFGGASASDDCSAIAWSNDFTALSDDCGATGSATVTFTVTDGCGNSSTTTAIFTIEDTTAPTFNEALPSDVTEECDAVSDPATLTADDNCGTANVTFTEVRTDGDCPSNYSLLRTWTATDECGLTTIHTQTVTVQDTTAPVTTTDFETEISVSCGDIPDAPELEFEDACSSNITVEFEETSTNDGSISDYEITRIWTVSDECGNTDVYSQIIFVAVNGATGGTADLCIEEDFDFDLFSLLTGDYDFDGTWEVTSGNATISGSYFNPSSLLDADGHYTFEQLQDIYTFVYTSTGDCPTETEVTITLNDLCRELPCGDSDGVIISKAVTANGDQWNEYFTITGIEGCGFTVEVQIFNRWGALIYESNDYQNNWNAFVHGSSVGGSDKVPTGTYYYIINLKESGLKPFAGPIYVGTK